MFARYVVPLTPSEALRPIKPPSREHIASESSQIPLFFFKRLLTLSVSKSHKSFACHRSEKTSAKSKHCHTSETPRNNPCVCHTSETPGGPSPFRFTLLVAPARPSREPLRRARPNGTPPSLSLPPLFPYPYLLSFHSLAHSFALFCTRQKLNPFLFKRFRTLSQKHRGVGTPSHCCPAKHCQSFRSRIRPC